MELEKERQIPCRAAWFGTRSGRHDGLREWVPLPPPGVRRRTIWIRYQKLSLSSSATYKLIEEKKRRNNRYKIRHFLSLFEQILTNFSTKTAFSDAFCHGVSALGEESRLRHFRKSSRPKRDLQAGVTHGERQPCTTLKRPRYFLVARLVDSGVGGQGRSNRRACPSPARLSAC